MDNPETPPQSVFFRLHPSLRQVIHSSLGWHELRDIQELAYEPVMAGENLLLMARTAGGKSEAAFIPVLDTILTRSPALPVCLYISPLRALISDLATRLDALLSPLHLSAVQIHGDAPRQPGSPDPPALILTTPESLTVLLYRKGSPLLDRIRICIIDEVHALAGSERGAQLMTALAMMEAGFGVSIQRVGLSATIGNPDEVLGWMSPAGRPASVIRAGPEPLAREFHFLTGGEETGGEVLLPLLRGRRSLVFTRSRSEAEILSQQLDGAGVPIFVHHSSLSPASRREAEAIFVSGPGGAIICTSTLELGIDVGALDLVVQSGPVQSISSFLQRLGRVGRRGEPGSMAFLLRSREEIVFIAAAIAAAATGVTEPVIPIRSPLRVVVQQVILTLLSEGRVGRETLIRRLAGVITPRVDPGKIAGIIGFLESRGDLMNDRGFLMIGPSLEARGRQGAFYSVIGEGRICDVRTGSGDLVGTLPVSSADQVRTRPFRLGGRTWSPGKSDPGESTLSVSPDSFPADPPVFRGTSPGMSATLMMMTASLLNGTLPDPGFPQEVRSAVDEMRVRLPPGTGPDTLVVLQDEGLVLLFTFLGDEWNRVLAYWLRKEYRSEYSRSLRTESDGMTIRLSSPGVSSGWVSRVLARYTGQTRAPPLLPAGEPGRLYDSFLPEEMVQEMAETDRLRVDLLITALSERRILEY